MAELIDTFPGLFLTYSVLTELIGKTFNFRISCDIALLKMSIPFKIRDGPEHI